MKKFKKNRINRTRDDSPTAGGHIHFEQILAFARESADFTEKEEAHFDVCSTCRFRVFYALRSVASQVVRTATTKAA
jgi:hypothetical protein